MKRKGVGILETVNNMVKYIDDFRGVDVEI